MSDNVYGVAGYVGCNACGSVKAFNCNRPKIYWRLCRDCNEEYQYTKLNPPNNPNKVTFRNGPFGKFDANNNYWWEVSDNPASNWGPPDPINKIKVNMYHLFDKVVENRERHAYPSLTRPEINSFIFGSISSSSSSLSTSSD